MHDKQNSNILNSSAAEGETRLKLLYEIGRVLAASEKMGVAAPQILEGICRHLGFDVGELWSLDESAKVLRRKNFWHLPSATLEQFAVESQSLEFSVGEGLPGKVWEKNAPVWIENLRVENDLARRLIAERAGMRSAFAFPILLGDKFLGAFCFFCEKHCPHDEALLQMLVAVGGNIGQFIKRERVERDLRVSEENFRALVQASSQAIWTTDIGGQNLEAYGWWENQTGQTREESKDGGFLEAIHPDDRARAGKIWQSAIVAVKPFETECRITDRNGEYQYFAISGVPVFNSDGSFRQWFGTLTDISDRKNAEQSLKNNEERYRALVEATSTVVWRTNQSGGLNFVGEAWEKVSGQRVEDILGAGWLNALHPDDREETMKVWQRALAAKSIYETEFRVLTTTGEYRWFAARGVPIMDGEGSVREWVGANSDIHERKLAEEKTRESEERYRTLFETMDEGFCLCEMIYDADGKPFDYRFLEVNPTFEQMTGLENAAGGTARELIPNLEAHWFETYGKVVSTGESVRFTDRAEAMNRWFDVYASRVGDRENRRFAILFNNITERVQADEKIKSLGERNRDILESITDGFFTLDRDWRFTYVNSQAELILNRKPGDLTGNVIWDEYQIVGTEFETAYRRTANENVVSTFTAYYPDHDSWYEVNAYPAPNGITVYFRNVTDRVRGQEILRESEEKYRALTELSSQMIWMLNAAGEITYLSPKWFEYTSLTLEDSQNQGWASILHPDERETVIADFGKYLERGEEYEMQLRLLGKDETYRRYLSRAAPLRDEAGKVEKWFGVTFDVDDVRHAEENLRESRERLRFALESANVGDWDLDLASGQVTGSILHDKCFGATEPFPDWSYEKFLTYVHPEDRAEVKRQFEQSLAENQEWHFECRVIWADRSVHWIEGHGSIYRTIEEKPVRMLGIVNDITDRKRRELNAEFLAEISQELVSLESGEDIVRTVGAKVGAYLELSACNFVEINEAADEANVSYVWHRADMPSAVGVYRLSDYVTEEVYRLAHAGEMFIVSDTATDSRTDAARHAALKMESFVAVPLVRNGEWRFQLVVADAMPRDWQTDEIELIRELTTRLWTRLERARAEESLRENQEVLSLAMSSSRMGAWSRDLTSETVYWSVELEEIFGLAAGTFSGNINGFYDYVYDEDKESLACEVKSALDEHRDYVVEFRFRHADGSLRWMEGRGQAIYADDGKPVKAYGIGIEITERKQAEADLRESEDKFRNLANSISQLAWIADETGHIFWYNERWFEYTGTTLGDMEGWGWQKVHHPGEIGRVTEKFQDHLASGEIWEDTFPIRSKSGEYRWFLSRALPIRDENNQIVRWFGTNTDITERREIEAERERLLEREQQAREIAEQANHAKDEFIALVSHELRSPLNAMLGWTRILQNRKADEKTTRHALDVIVRNALSQSRLIEDLLDIARIGKGKLRLELAPMELVPIINNAVEIIKPTAESKNIRLSQTLERTATLITGDGDRLRQVVENLLANAVKFTPDGGSVSVRLEREESLAKIIVSDDGQGISAEFLPQIFERFKQADPSTTRRHGGLGIGLSLARDLVELHGGTISAQSAGEGKGSTFIVKLPLRSVAPIKDITGKVENMDSQGKLSGFWILAVDDEADAREIISFMLQINGARVTSANSAVEALEILKNANERIPDILLSDISMPNESGYALLEKIRSLPREQGGQIPAVALTAFNRPEDREAAFEAGFQKHLGKPVDMDALIDAIVETASIKHA